MNNIMDKNQLETNEGNNKSRRRFITQASTGLVLASLPARSVWAGGSHNASVMGSMNGSNAMDQTKLCLRSHGYFKNHHSSFSKCKEKYHDCFGGKAFNNDGSKIRLITKNDWGRRGEYYPDLSEIVRCEGNGRNGIAMELDDGRIIPDGSINPTFTGKMRACKRKHSTSHKRKRDRNNWYANDDDHDQVGEFNLSGPSNVNTQMTCMYLNAAYHGQAGIWYPVLKKFGGTFDSLQQFGWHLYDMAAKNPHGIGAELANLIDSHPV